MISTLSGWSNTKSQVGHVFGSVDSGASRTCLAVSHVNILGTFQASYHGLNRNAKYDLTTNDGRIITLPITTQLLLCLYLTLNVWGTQSVDAGQH